MERQEISELVALHALDVLADPDRATIELGLAEDISLQQEWAADQETIAAFAYSVPLQPLADRLKDRLMASLASPDIASLRRAAATIDWEEYFLAPQTQVGKYLIDDEKREIQCFVRATGAVKFPTHRHADEEEIVVLEGDLTIDGKQYQAGDRICSTPGTVHQPSTTHGCFLFLRTSLDDETLELLEP
jgi:hypothetical protein